MWKHLWLLSLSLCGTLACGATNADEAAPSVPGVIEVRAGTPGAPNVGTPDVAPSRDQSGAVQAQSGRCCYAQCRNPGDPWTAASNRGQPDYGRCSNRAKAFCGAYHFQYFYAFWDPCR